MKRLTPLILLVVAGSAQADNTFNPLSMLAPVQNNPWSGGYGNISSPFGLGALNPMNPLNSINPLSPWNNYGGLSNPVLSLGALSALGVLTPSFSPGMQFAPNMQSSGYFNQMNTPFQGNPFAGNPYARLPMQQSFSTPAFSPSMPSFPNMPFAAQQQQIPGYFMLPQQMGQPQYAPQQQAFPFLPYGMQQQQQQQSLANLFGLQQQPVQQQPSFPNFFGSPQPAPQPQPSLQNFFGMTQPAAQPKPQPAAAQPTLPFLPFLLPQAPQAPQAMPPAMEKSKPAAQPVVPQNSLPFFFFTPQAAPAAAPAPAPKPASEPLPEVKADDTAPMPPLDPAAFMQMYMQPQDANK